MTDLPDRTHPLHFKPPSREDGVSAEAFAPEPLGRLPHPEALKGRGSAWQLAHRFERREREQFDDGWGSLDQAAQELSLPPETQIIEEEARSIISSNQSPDISFDRSINPYRGCEHGCIYIAGSI